jgi:hypothetical protein
MSVLNDLIQKTDDYLNQRKLSIEDIKVIISELKKEHLFDYARKLIKHSISLLNKDEEYQDILLLNQKLALCTYKDIKLNPGSRFKDAFKVLNDIDPLNRSINLECSGTVVLAT